MELQGPSAWAYLLALVVTRSMTSRSSEMDMIIAALHLIVWLYGRGTLSVAPAMPLGGCPSPLTPRYTAF